MRKPNPKMLNMNVFRDLTITHCSRNCEEFYPYYGKAPHKSFNTGNGKVDSRKILSNYLPIEKWKEENFLPEVNEGEELEEIAAPCGEYYCPLCKNGQANKISNFYKKYEK